MTVWWGQIVLASHHEKGLLVSRLIRFDQTDALVSDRREYESSSGERRFQLADCR